jgi:hypothetical protein
VRGGPIAGLDAPQGGTAGPSLDRT